MVVLIILVRGEEEEGTTEAVAAGSGCVWSESALRYGQSRLLRSEETSGTLDSGIIAPGGYAINGPQGVTFVGTGYSEPVLIAIAYAYEQATKHRVPPFL
jgi:hypothetical protein